MPLALYTFGLFARPADDPANAGFHALNDPVFAEVDAAPGLIARSGYPDEPGPACWGPMVWPEAYVERGDGWAPATLSLWEDIDAPARFAYGGLHARALGQGARWFVRGDWPPLALWWTDAGHRPDWTEAVARHARLWREGPTPAAFTFARPFDRAGRAVPPPGAAPRR